MEGSAKHPLDDTTLVSANHIFYTISEQKINTVCFNNCQWKQREKTFTNPCNVLHKNMKEENFYEKFVLHKIF